MEQIEIEIDQPGLFEKVLIDADTKDGLAVHRSSYDGEVLEGEEAWTVTHITSGLALARDLPTCAAALSLRGRILTDIPVDWHADRALVQQHVRDGYYAKLQQIIAEANSLDVPE